MTLESGSGLRDKEPTSFGALGQQAWKGPALNFLADIDYLKIQWEFCCKREFYQCAILNATYLGLVQYSELLRETIESQQQLKALSETMDTADHDGSCSLTDSCARSLTPLLAHKLFGCKSLFHMVQSEVDGHSVTHKMVYTEESTGLKYLADMHTITGNRSFLCNLLVEYGLGKIDRYGRNCRALGTNGLSTVHLDGKDIKTIVIVRIEVWLDVCLFYFSVCIYISICMYVYEWIFYYYLY